MVEPWMGLAAAFALGLLLGAAWALMLFGLVLARVFGVPALIGVRAGLGYVIAMAQSVTRRFPPDLRGGR